MVPGVGRLTANVIKEKYIKRIEAFGLNFVRDIINSTNDGCSVMKSVGKKILPKLMQLCLAHGFQLGVVKTFYLNQKKKKKSQDIEDENEDDESMDEYEDEIGNLESDTNESSDEESDDDEDEIEEPDDETGFIQEYNGEPIEAIAEFEEILKKWRKIVNEYHGKSTPRKDFFQQAIKKWQKEKVHIYILLILSTFLLPAIQLYGR